MVGLLASSKIPTGIIVYYGIIADGIHTHPAALRIAHRTHPEGKSLKRNIFKQKVLAFSEDHNIITTFEGLSWYHLPGIVLVTDAINAMGLPIGTYSLGSQSVEVRNNGGFIAGTNTLCGR